MEKKYQTEIDEFQARFQKYKDKRIVLYGIGRYTATLLDGQQGFHFVGLMDKNPENIGKHLFGLPVMDVRTVEQQADLIVINTSETYWELIYSRLQGIKIPVYYKNGERARRQEQDICHNPFQGLSYQGLWAKIKAADIVSFDFFDTLFMRSVCSPQDIFRFMDIEWEKKQIGFTFSEMRNKAKKELRKAYSLEELYRQMEVMLQLPDMALEDEKEREMELEEEQLVPRIELLSCFKQACKMGKEVYIISDMYLPEKFYRKVLESYKIFLPEGHILLSHALDASKSDGTLWGYYIKTIVKGKQALHIGDNQRADMEEAKKAGVETYLAPSAWALFGVSSIKDAAYRVGSLYSTVVMGLLLKELFHNPYILQEPQGKIEIKKNQQMGYCVFGPVILTFCLWLLKKSKQDGVKKLVFLSRDGYFLKQEFEFLCGQLGEEIETSYLGISRQLAMVAAIESKEDLLEYITMPYTGSIKERFADRLGIEGIEEKPGWQIEDYITFYLPEIKKYVEKIRSGYLSYLGQMALDQGCAIVDLGYYGNNQRYLNKLTKNAMPGYYFNANLSKQNQNTEKQKMEACFQGKEDLTGENSQVKRKMIYIESFLTAPYGMVKAVSGEGIFLCAPKKKNQEHFQEKVEIHQGVEDFIKDYVKNAGEFKIPEDIAFVDWFYGYGINGGFSFTEEIKSSFYNDNAMMNRMESMLFY